MMLTYDKGSAKENEMQDVNNILQKISNQLVPEKDLAVLKEAATKIVSEVYNSNGDLSKISMFDSIGSNASSTMSSFLARPQSDLNKLSVAGTTDVTTQITKLRQETDRMTPGTVNNFLFNMLAKIGLQSVGNKVAGWASKQIYEKSESIQQNINGVVKGLLTTKGTAIDNNSNLESLDKQTKDIIVSLRQNLNLCKYIAEELEVKRTETDDTQDANFLLKVHHRVMMKIQYLMMSEQMLLQYRIGIGTVHEGNLNIIDSLENLVYVVAKTLPIGLSLRMAAADQDKSISIVKGTTELCMTTLEDSAISISNNVRQIAEIAEGSLLPIERLQKTCDVIIGAAEELKSSYQKGINEINKQIPLNEKLRLQAIEHTPVDSVKVHEIKLDATDLLKLQ
jgi:uncharacterized protein YaaN involved in tellurite resistance